MLGNAHVKIHQGNLQAACDYLGHGVKNLRRNGTLPNLSEFLSFQSTLLGRLGKLRYAAQAAKESLTIRRELHLPVQSTLGEISQVLYYLKDYESSAKIAGVALKSVGQSSLAETQRMGTTRLEKPSRRREFCDGP